MWGSEREVLFFTRRVSARYVHNVTIIYNRPVTRPSYCYVVSRTMTNIYLLEVDAIVNAVTSLSSAEPDGYTSQYVPSSELIKLLPVPLLLTFTVHAKTYMYVRTSPAWRVPALTS